MKVLVIDDAPDIAEVVELCFELRWPGTTLLSAPDGETGLDVLEQEKPDFVILDIGLPGMDGYQVCREIRRSSQVPILILSVRDESTDIARGLELGADTYLTKPFSHIELLARTHAVLRRIQGIPHGDSGDVLESGNLRLDVGSREVWVGPQKVRLTPIEFSILHHLVRNAGRTVSHPDLVAAVWGPDATQSSKHLKVHIQHMRQKLGDDLSRPNIIATEWKMGYNLVS